MHRVLNKIISALGRKNYEVDRNIITSALFLIIFRKTKALIRGFFLLKPFANSSKGLVFIGRHSFIYHKNKLSHGSTLIIGSNVKINCLSIHGVSLGKNVSIKDGTVIECLGVLSEIGEGLEIGDNVGISQACFIQVRGKVIIGNDVIMGPGAKIFSENHNFLNKDKPIRLQGVTRKGVIIEDDVWIGADVKILDGVVIGKRSIIAAGSVVTKSFPPNSIIGGVPAKVLQAI